MGYASVYTPTRSMSMDEYDLGQAPKALCCMKNLGWMWSMSKHQWQTSPSKMDGMCTCKNWSHHARVWGSMNMLKQQAKVRCPRQSQLSASSTSDRGPEAKRLNGESIMCFLNILKKWRSIDIRTLTSGWSLSKWNMSKQTWNLVASEWSYNSNRNEGQG